jgi:hypothetical protein
MTDTELLEQRFRPHPGHRIHRTGVSRGGSYVVEGQYLETIGGVPIRVSLGEVGARLLEGLDGNRSLGTLASQLTPTRGMTAGDAARSAVQLVTELFAFGFLEIDGSAIDPRGFVEIDVDSMERSLVTS